MKSLREQTTEKFERMRARATNVVRSTVLYGGKMGPIKSFGDLHDAIE